MAHDGHHEGTKVTPLKDGPIKVEGVLQLCAADGSVVERKDTMFLCRCGASANKPYCDGAHKAAGFQAD